MSKKGMEQVEVFRLVRTSIRVHMNTCKNWEGLWGFFIVLAPDHRGLRYTRWNFVGWSLHFVMLHSLQEGYREIVKLIKLEHTRTLQAFLGLLVKCSRLNFQLVDHFVNLTTCCLDHLDWGYLLSPADKVLPSKCSFDIDCHGHQLVAWCLRLDYRRCCTTG